METIIGLSVLAALGYGAYALGRKVTAAATARTPAPNAHVEAARFAAQRRAQAALRQRQEQRRRLNLKARHLQLALLHLDETPDFRRAASWAAHAKDAPLAFRQRQFRRFRSRLVAHLAARLAGGGDAEVLMRSLADLLQHLGVAGFEADYLRVEAERGLVRPVAARPSYEQQVTVLQREHAERVTALQSLTGIDEETRERLLEAEDNRFRQTLERLGDDPQRNLP